MYVYELSKDFLLGKEDQLEKREGQVDEAVPASPAVPRNPRHGAFNSFPSFIILAAISY